MKSLDTCCFQIHIWSALDAQAYSFGTKSSFTGAHQAPTQKQLCINEVHKHSKQPVLESYY